MYKWLWKQFTAFGRTSKRFILGKYDAAQTTGENKRHWAQADNLSANAAMNPSVRRVLRNRARYEIANNSYASGIVDTLANYVIGTGPRLQMLTKDADLNRTVEAEFTKWAKAINLSDKLWTTRVSQTESGEGFNLLITNLQLDSPVKLDLKLIEADRVTTPVGLYTAQMQDPSKLVDGIKFDQYGNPQFYYVLRQHPGDMTLFSGNTGEPEYDQIPASYVIHLYKQKRAGQSRGVPEITPALPLFAMMRRYTLAVLSTAENAASVGGVIHTDAPADPDISDVDPMDEIDMDRNTWMTMPFGWTAKQIKAEQPTTVYSDFKHEILNECARPLNMPYNLASGNSSGYNYASGRLDHQAFYKAVQIDQNHINTVVMDRIFDAWMEEARKIPDFLPDQIIDSEFKHQWFWDGYEHVDPSKEATAQEKRLKNNTTTLAAEYAKQGLDWENEIRQKAKEKKLLVELDLTPSEAKPSKSKSPDKENKAA